MLDFEIERLSGRDVAREQRLAGETGDGTEAEIELRHGSPGGELAHCFSDQ